MGDRAGRVFVTDCEGPVTRNDNAAELSDAFIPQGHRFFSRISLYDDYLAEIARKPGYKAGDTLRLILPFLKAYGVDHQAMSDFSRQNIQIIPLADSVLRGILDYLPGYIVSTSYSPYIKAVCKAIKFPFENTFRTEVNVDAYPLNEEERAALKEIYASIMELQEFIIPVGAKSPEELPEEARKTIARLDEIFWEELPRMEINRIIEEINPIGGREKARAVQTIAEKEGITLRNVMYVGDSITDVDALRLVRESEGLAVSFNGNHWAVREASFAVTAQNALPIGWLAELFAREGAEAFRDLMLSEVTAENSARISELSSRVRKEVRSEKIGSLG